MLRIYLKKSSAPSMILLTAAFNNGFGSMIYREKELSLSHSIIEKVKAMRKKAELKNTPKTREEELEEQVANLKKALAYSELRNELLTKVIEINSKEYGVDMLKKNGTKQ